MEIENTPIPAWHQIVKNRDLSRLAEIIDDEAVFFSPVMHTPQVGKELVIMYLAAAGSVLLNGTFRYVREIIGERDAFLEFIAEIDGITINGVDIIKWNEAGMITEFKVMIRPLKAIAKMQEMMATK